jgi:hypothetical protein
MTRGAARTPARPSARANITTRRNHGIYFISCNLPFIDWIAYHRFGSADDAGGNCTRTDFRVRRWQNQGPAAASQVARDECSILSRPHQYGVEQTLKSGCVSPQRWFDAVTICAIAMNGGYSIKYGRCGPPTRNGDSGVPSCVSRSISRAAWEIWIG